MKRQPKPDLTYELDPETETIRCDPDMPPLTPDARTKLRALLQAIVEQEERPVYGKRRKSN